jgi:Na+/proline symporter
MISRFDYFIIAVYLVFLAVIGVVFRRMSKDTSDYFRAGGSMPWYITGTSAWVFSFSAWTFTGAAGKVYETGTLVLVVFYATALALTVALAFTCVRFRRMRVVTWTEAVRLRYGPLTEQFYIWIKLPLLLFFAGVSLNAVGVFMAAVFKVDLAHLLATLGVVVTLIAFTGGSWAVLASDFMQALLVVTITISTALMTLGRPEIGGLAGLAAKAPPAHFHWTQLARPQVIFLWVLANLWFKFSDENNMERSTMYLMTRSDRDARLMVWIPLAGMLIGPLFWFIPSMAAAVTHPHLAVEFPQLPQPHEAAFVAVSLDVMPAGLIGLLLCAMLGSTVTSMDAGLNKNVGICIRSLYKPVFRPQASEKHLLVAGKICTLLFGLVVIACALLVNQFRRIGLFDLLNQLSANILMPLALPLIYGLFFKRTPGWSAWTTVLVAGLSSWALGRYVKPRMFQHCMGWTTPLSPREETDFLLAITTCGTAAVGTAWYFLTSLFYQVSPPAERARSEAFFDKLSTPLATAADSGPAILTHRLLGGLCMAYGTFVLLLMLIPNRLAGRLAFLFSGGVILGVGALMFAFARRRETAAASGVTAARHV